MCCFLYADVSDCQSGSEDEDEVKEGGAGGVCNSGPHDNPLAVLQVKLKELSTAYELVIKNNHQLAKFASELESGGSAGKPKEKFALMKITSAAVVKVRGGVVCVFSHRSPFPPGSRGVHNSSTQHRTTLVSCLTT